MLRPREVPYREPWALPRDVLLLIELSIRLAQRLPVHQRWRRRGEVEVPVDEIFR